MCLQMLHVSSTSLCKILYVCQVNNQLMSSVAIVWKYRQENDEKITKFISSLNEKYEID